MQTHLLRILGCIATMQLIVVDFAYSSNEPSSTAPTRPSVRITTNLHRLFQSQVPERALESGRGYVLPMDLRILAVHELKRQPEKILHAILTRNGVAELRDLLTSFSFSSNRLVYSTQKFGKGLEYDVNLATGAFSTQYIFSAPNLLREKKSFSAARSPRLPGELYIPEVTLATLAAELGEWWEPAQTVVATLQGFASDPKRMWLGLGGDYTAPQRGRSHFRVTSASYYLPGTSESDNDHEFTPINFEDVLYDQREVPYVH